MSHFQSLALNSSLPISRCEIFVSGVELISLLPFRECSFLFDTMILDIRVYGDQIDDGARHSALVIYLAANNNAAGAQREEKRRHLLPSFSPLCLSLCRRRRLHSGNNSLPRPRKNKTPTGRPRRSNIVADRIRKIPSV